MGVIDSSDETNATNSIRKRDTPRETMGMDTPQTENADSRIPGEERIQNFRQCGGCRWWKVKEVVVKRREWRI